jgi:hypothetical protein
MRICLPWQRFWRCEEGRFFLTLPQGQAHPLRFNYDAKRLHGLLQGLD